MTDPHLRFTQTVIVGYVEGVSSSSRVHPACSSFLQPQVVEDFGETLVLHSVFNHLLHGAVNCKRKIEEQVIILI